jgi:hypothetical protein
MALVIRLTAAICAARDSLSWYKRAISRSISLIRNRALTLVLPSAILSFTAIPRRVTLTPGTDQYSHLQLYHREKETSIASLSYKVSSVNSGLLLHDTLAEDGVFEQDKSQVLFCESLTMSHSLPQRNIGCHCERREAISCLQHVSNGGDCFVASLLAMTTVVI